MIEKSKQSALPVIPIQRNEEIYVDTHYSFPNRGVFKHLKHLIMIIINEREKFDEVYKKELSEYFGVVLSKYIEKSQLGLEIELSSIDEIRVRSIQNYLSGRLKGLTWPPNLSNYGQDLFFCQKDSHEYHGNFKLRKLPPIKMRRRRSRYHHQRFVGVGYRDKGSSKDQSYDGTPDFGTSSGEINRQRERAEIVIRNIRLEFTGTRKTLDLTNGPKSVRRKVDLMKFRCQNGLWEVFQVCSNTNFARHFVQELREEDYSYVQRRLCATLTNGKYFLRKV